MYYNNIVSFLDGKFMNENIFKRICSDKHVTMAIVHSKASAGCVTDN